MKPNEKGGAGYLGYEDKTFTIATAPDQWILAPITQPISNPMNEPAQPTPVGKPIRYLSVCSGMEAASVAWHPLGWQPVGLSEIEPFPCAILKHRFPNIPNHGSLTEYKQWPLEPGAIDLLVGGTPCQSFSVAGLRKGLDDPRGNLALVFLGLADKLKPRWIVWENVPGVLSSAGGRDFGSFLGALVELGYGFAYRVLDAQHFGVPQRRRRVFVVACLGDWRAPAEVLLESDCVRRDPKKGRAKGQGVAAGAEGGVDADGIQRTVGTLCADTHPGAYSGQDAYSGRLIPQAFTVSGFAHYEAGVGTVRASGGDCGPGSETLHVEPLPIDFRNNKIFDDPNISGTIQAKSSGGYSLNYTTGILQSIPFRKYKRAYSTTDNETWVEADASNTLNNFDLGDTRTTHAVVEKPMAVRRLTPVECERLQGFPDNWSRISWKGKPEDQCPDGPRYKACGNSMAVPVMSWIGQRIHNYELSQNHEAK